ncbi:MAG: hypothetical protein ACOH2V_00145 [Candidatus Saccharimonadaceae bacterium]
MYVNGVNSFAVGNGSYVNLNASTNITLTTIPGANRVDISSPNSVQNVAADSSKVTIIKVLTQAQYTALGGSVVSTTMYVII